MNKALLTFFALVMAMFLSAPSSYAQGAAKTGPDPSTIRDPELEKDSLHNLEVARHYFKLKKAYVAAIKRCEEIDAGNPNFAKMDEVLFIAGESSLRLAENRENKSQKRKLQSNCVRTRECICLALSPSIPIVRFVNWLRLICNRLVDR